MSTYTFEMDGHQAQAQHFCAVCERKITNDDERMALHASCVKSYPMELRYPCYHCDKMYKREHFRRTHERTMHHIKRVYFCTMCPEPASPTMKAIEKHISHKHPDHKRAALGEREEPAD